MSADECAEYFDDHLGSDSLRVLRRISHQRLESEDSAETKTEFVYAFLAQLIHSPYKLVSALSSCYDIVRLAGDSVRRVCHFYGLARDLGCFVIEVSRYN